MCSLPQLEQIRAFRKRVKGIALIGEYESADKFTEVVQPKLTLALQRLFAKEPRSAPGGTGSSAVRLTPPEVELLLSVPDSGEILRLEVDSEPRPFIRAGRSGRHFPSRSDPSVAAVFGKALAQLVERGLVEHSAKMLYLLTAEGLSARAELIRLATHPDDEMGVTLEVPAVLILMLLARDAGDEGLTLDDVARELRLPQQKAKYFVDLLYQSAYIQSGWSQGLGYSIKQPGRAFLHVRGFL
jgi:hypothetical protein